MPPGPAELAANPSPRAAPPAGSGARWDLGTGLCSPLLHSSPLASQLSRRKASADLERVAPAPLFRPSGRIPTSDPYSLNAPSAPAGRVGSGETRKEQTSPPGAIRSR